MVRDPREEESASYLHCFVAGGECVKNGLRLIALGSTLSVAAIAAPPMMAITVGGAQDQYHHDYTQEQAHPDYSNNHYYKMGNSEGYEDYKRKTQRKEHDHKYRNDDDRKAHDYGYQQGWQGQRYSGDHDHVDQR
jgi:hypothetical protein